LDQIQNFTIDLNHRIRDLEVRQTTNPRDFLQKMAILFTDRIDIMKSDMFEQLQKLTKHEELLAEFYGELRTHSSVASTNEANIEFNQKMIEQLRQKVERHLTAWHQNISESRHNARTVRNSVPIKQSEGEQNELQSLPERLNKTLENEIYGNMTDLRGELMRQIAEAIEVFERDLKRTSEMIRDTIIKNDVSHRVEKLEKNQVYILDQIQQLSLKQSFGDFPKRNVNSTKLKKLPEFSDERLLKTEKSGDCECDIPSAIGQAIIQQQLRMDLVLSDQSTMLLELKSRKEENEFLAIEVRKLKEERQQILSVVSEYQHEVKKLLEWKNRDEPIIQEHQRRLDTQANSISSNAAVAHFTKHRLQKARFRCAGHGKKKGSFCFNLSKDARSWDAAEQRCKRQGGSLAVIKDEETMLFITNLIRGSSYDTSYWIGLSLEKETERLNWVDNTTISENSFQNWYEDLQPTRSERCIQSAGSLWDYKWYPSKCDRELRYICQV